MSDTLQKEGNSVDHEAWGKRKTRDVHGCQVTPLCWLNVLETYGCSSEVYQNIGILFPNTIPKSEELSKDPRLRNFELALRNDIDSRKSRWSGNCMVDFLIYHVTAIPVFAIFCTHPASSLFWDLRIIVAVLDFLMFASAFIYEQEYFHTESTNHFKNQFKSHDKSTVVGDVINYSLFATMILFTMVQKAIVQKISKSSCSCNKRALVYSYFFIFMVPLLFLLFEYVAGSRFSWSANSSELRGWSHTYTPRCQVLYAFLWSIYTSCGKSVVYFAVDSINCLKTIHHTILCGCCSEVKKSKVKWKHFQIWKELGRPNMLELKGKELWEIQIQAREKFGENEASLESIEELGRGPQTSSIELKNAQELYI